MAEYGMTGRMVTSAPPHKADITDGAPNVRFGPNFGRKAADWQLALATAWAWKSA